MKNLLKLLKMIKGTYSKIGLLILISIIYGGLNAAWPIALRWIINNGNNLLAGKNQTEVFQILAVFLIIAIILAFLIAILESLSMNLSEYTYVFVENKLNVKVYERSQKLTHSYFEANSPGSILQKVNSGISSLNMWIESLGYALIEPTVIVIYSLIIIGIISPISSLLIFIFLLFYVLQFKKTRDKADPIFKKTQRDYERLYGKLSESYSNFSTIRSMSAEKIFRNKISNSSKNIFERQRYEIRIWFISMAQRVFAARLILFVVIIYLLYSLWQGKINTGDIVMIAIFILQINANAYNFSRFISNQAEANIKAGRLVNFLEKTPIIQDSPDATELKSIESIEFKNVSFSYGEGLQNAVSNISFVIDKGKSLALVGPSGVGKSTITKLLMRFYEPTHGEILVNKQVITKYTQESLRRQIAIVMQDVALFNTTLKQNLLLASPKASEHKIQKALDDSNSTSFLSDLNKGINTLVGERGVKLSGGQKQRIGIARAILKNPDLVILDEATSALDSESEKQVQDALKKLLHDKMSLIIAHRLSTVRHVDEIIVLKNGRVFERGSHTALLRKKGLYAKLFNIQSKTGKNEL